MIFTPTVMPLKFLFLACGGGGVVLASKSSCLVTSAVGSLKSATEVESRRGDLLRGLAESLKG